MGFICCWRYCNGLVFSVSVKRVQTLPLVCAQSGPNESEMKTQRTVAAASKDWMRFSQFSTEGDSLRSVLLHYVFTAVSWLVRFVQDYARNYWPGFNKS